MIAFLIVIGVVLFLSNTFFIIQVCGDSMYPTYLNGEIIVGTKLYRKSKLKKGDVILFICPTDTERTVIKRIDHISYKNGIKTPLFYCLGDNVNNSHDSRDYGFVTSQNLVCKVINPRRNIYYECD